jgi:hypothetical protein
MNVKSKFEPEEEQGAPRSQYMRGMCGMTFSMIDGPTRMDVSEVHVPGFFEKIFRALGWKTAADKHAEK